MIHLGYGDSGLDGQAPGATFVTADRGDATARLAQILHDLDADLLTIYDARGGYGHPDHRRVHEVGLRAAREAGTPLVLAATLDRTLLQRVVRLLRVLRRGRGLPQLDVQSAYTPRSELTHRVDVRAYTAAKRRAMQAHASRATADEGDRTLAFLLRLPMPLFRLATGHEWFVQIGRAQTRPLCDDVLADFHP